MSVTNRTFRNPLWRYRLQTPVSFVIMNLLFEPNPLWAHWQSSDPGLGSPCLASLSDSIAVIPGSFKGNCKSTVLGKVVMLPFSWRFIVSKLGVFSIQVCPVNMLWNCQLKQAPQRWLRSLAFSWRAEDTVCLGRIPSPISSYEEQEERSMCSKLFLIKSLECRPWEKCCRYIRMERLCLEKALG